MSSGASSKKKIKIKQHSKSFRYQKCMVTKIQAWWRGCSVRKEKKIFTDNYFWEKIINSNLLTDVKPKIEHLLNEFGTLQRCNRFDVGNTIEFILNDHIVDSGFKVNELSNAKRYDVAVENYKKLSIKYSSVGPITLHNSNSCVNTDLEMKDTILLTPEKLYLIIHEELVKHKINVKEYLKNAGDSLKLKRSILNMMEKKKLPIYL